MHDTCNMVIYIIQFCLKIIQSILKRINVKRRIATKMRRFLKGDKYNKPCPAEHCRSRPAGYWRKSLESLRAPLYALAHGLDYASKQNFLPINTKWNFPPLSNGRIVR